MSLDEDHQDSKRQADRIHRSSMTVAWIAVGISLLSLVVAVVALFCD